MHHHRQGKEVFQVEPIFTEFIIIKNVVSEFLGHLVCTIGHEYWPNVTNFVFFDHACCPYPSISAIP